MIDSANDEIIKSILAGLTEEQKQNLIDQVVGVPGEKNEKNPKGKDELVKDRVNPDFTVNRDLTEKVREPVKAKKNKWKDEGEDQDVSTPMFEKTPRSRKAHKMESVECHMCGKEFKIDPSNTYGEFHRCNRCGGR